MSTHGPTPTSSWRESTTVTPAAVSRSRIRRATSQVNACSGYPSLVSVPVVLQGFVPPAPSGTGVFTISGCAAFPPLWPGSSTTTTGGGRGAGGSGGDVVDVVGAGAGTALDGAPAREEAAVIPGASGVAQPAMLTRSTTTAGRSHRTGPA